MKAAAAAASKVGISENGGNGVAKKMKKAKAQASSWQMKIIGGNENG
jgi:hypothetical protein